MADQKKEVVLEKTIHLRVPVPGLDGKELIDHLDLREPEAGELEESSKMPTATGVALRLISMVSGQPLKVIRKLRNRDLTDCANFLNSFSEVDASGEQDGTGSTE